MLDRSDLIYRYDGSFDGMLCCVFESFYAKERPGSIQGSDAAQMLLLEEKNIATDVQKAQRVRTSYKQNHASASPKNAEKVLLSDEGKHDYKKKNKKTEKTSVFVFI